MSQLRYTDFCDKISFHEMVSFTGGRYVHSLTLFPWDLLSAAMNFYINIVFNVNKIGSTASMQVPWDRNCPVNNCYFGNLANSPTLRWTSLSFASHKEHIRWWVFSVKIILYKIMSWQKSRHSGRIRDKHNDKQHFKDFSLFLIKTWT